MEVREALQKRRSIRKYKPDMVPKEIIEKIAEAGTYAATGMGKQSPIIIAVRKNSLMSFCMQQCPGRAPATEHHGIFMW